MFEAAQLIRTNVRQMAAYEPILPFEVLSQQLRLPSQAIIKLDANENPYGPLPAVSAALAELP
jgi:histidinol-phosphate aminotransferase